MTEFKTAPELAEQIRTSENTLSWWRQVGKGPEYVRLGKRVLYPVDGIESWIAAERRTA
ncbi:MAG: helix-turn-helix domain-containing protein [Sporichthyaceae bacterium]|nr:helix-turn-helix domain-containing protein [Sporichthyaceae bacterium]